MSKKLIVSEAAEMDIFMAMLWYETQLAGLSVEFDRKLDEAFQKIKNNPAGFQKRHGKLRIIFLSKFPYGVHYLVQGDLIKIMAVFHTSRDPETWRDQ